MRTLMALFGALIVNVFVNETAKAETLKLSIQQAAAQRQSVFVTAPHPLFGNNDKTRAVKLLRHEHDCWGLEADIPVGDGLEFTYYLRSDSPEDIACRDNGVKIGTYVSRAEPLLLAPQRITVKSHLNANASEVRLTSGGEMVMTINLERTVIDGKTIFLGDVDPEHRMNGHEMEVFVDGSPVLKDHAPIRCHAAPMFYSDGQAYHYDVTGQQSMPRKTEFTFTPSGFRQRMVSVLLPRGYDENVDKRYPVIYVEDGQHAFSNEDGVVSWEVDLTTTRMISRGEMPEVIVVAIDNTVDRSAEYTPEYATFNGTTGRGGEYAIAIRDGLLPIINFKYRTETDPAKNLHVGRSLGGLLGYHIARNHEETWGSVIAMSTVFSVGIEQNVAFADLPPSEWGRLYIDSGTAGENADDYRENMIIRDRLLLNGHVFGENFLHVVGNDQKHNEDAWRSRYRESMIWWASPLLGKALRP